ncbi:ARI5A protein, partial [Vireo altiloquus]|nr:ARI5A protein [Vireo altiloquus]
MSPLAKKKLLAQVSEAESLHCRKRHCPEGHRAPSHASPEGHQALSHASPEPPRPLPSPRLTERRSPEPSGAPDRAASVGSEVGAAPSPSPAGRDSQGCPRAEHRAPAVFTGYFHAYRSERLQPPLWGYFSNLKDFLEPPCAFPARPEEPEQPRELRSKAGPAWDGRGAAVQACWVPPGASFGLAEPRAGHGHHEEEEEDEEDDVDEEEEEEEEEPFGPTKLRTASPLARQGRDRRPRSPGGHQGLAKPRAVVATAAFPAPPDAFQGASLHFPGGFGTPLEHLRTQGVPLAPALSASPLVIPAFPSPLLLASARPPE